MRQGNNDDNINTHIGIIGGGVAGSTIAIRLAALGVKVSLIENNSSLISGPPMCHLHAGGNLYREISDDDAVELLKQSIDILRLYPYSIDVRPTVIAIPKRDNGEPEDLLPRLQRLTNVYEALIQQSPKNKVLGEPKDYYKLYDKQQMKTLAKRYTENMSAEDNTDSTNSHSSPHTNIKQDNDDWVAAAAVQLDLEQLKFPVVVVREYGWNIFRLSASASQALAQYPNADVLLDTKVTNVTATTQATPVNSNQANDIEPIITTAQSASQLPNKPYQQWQLTLQPADVFDASNSSATTDSTTTLNVDYLINASGFRTGIIDDMVQLKTERMVEFKTSYISHWPSGDATDNNHLPEIIIHGTRGTPHGMVQLTPYPGGYYQIHSMNNQVTLFEDGLVKSTADSTQPKLNDVYVDYIDNGWDKKALQRRNQTAIDDVSEFVPQFASAKPVDNALYGGQQIPGQDDSLRVADLSIHPDIRYARTENVKASSALVAADTLVEQLSEQQLITETKQQWQQRVNHQWQYLNSTDKSQIDAIARDLTIARHYPIQMAGVINSYL